MPRATTRHGIQPLHDRILAVQGSFELVSEKTAFNRTQVYNASSGRSVPHPIMVKQLCEYFDAEPEDLFNEDVLTEYRRLAADLDYLKKSCEKSNVPVRVEDPAVILAAADILKSGATNEQ